MGNIKGHVSSTAYRSTDDPLVFWLTVVFEDEALYRANAESPQQHRRWQQMQSIVDGEIEWNDGTVLMHGTPGNTYTLPKGG